MALFNKKKTEETKKETAAKAPVAEEKKGPSIHNVKVPAAKATPAKATAMKIRSPSICFFPYGDLVDQKTL
jgi:hypothetical protein